MAGTKNDEINDSIRVKGQKGISKIQKDPDSKKKNVAINDMIRSKKNSGRRLIRL